MRVFRKTNVSILVHKNGHNSICDRCFFMKLAPLDSAHIGPSIHAKNSIFFEKSPMVPFLIAGHIWVTASHAVQCCVHWAYHYMFIYTPCTIVDGDALVHVNPSSTDSLNEVTVNDMGRIECIFRLTMLYGPIRHVDRLQDKRWWSMAEVRATPML